jgi:hypothetical protein
MKICRETPNLVKIRQKYGALYMSTQAYFTLLIAPYVRQQYKETVIMTTAVMQVCHRATLYIACLVWFKILSVLGGIEVKLL